MSEKIEVSDLLAALQKAIDAAKAARAEEADQPASSEREGQR